jgi:hypothetical protein
VELHAEFGGEPAAVDGARQPLAGRPQLVKAR